MYARDKDLVGEYPRLLNALKKDNSCARRERKV